MSILNNDCTNNQNAIIQSDLKKRKPDELRIYHQDAGLNTRADLFNQYICDELLEFEF